MNDAKESLESNPIEILTSPSDACPLRKCDGSGFIWVKDWSKRHEKNVVDEWKEECECYEKQKKQREIDKKLDLSGIPPIFKNVKVYSFDTNKYTTEEDREIAEIAKTAAINFVNHFHEMKKHGKGLYFYSKVKGSGKTRLITSIANALVKEYGVELVFLKADDLLTQIKKTFKNDSETTEADIIRTFRHVEILVIDDIAVEKNSDFAERIFNAITDFRMENKMITLFTSNKTIEELGEIYKEGRVKSRIKKTTMQINFPEESIRDEEAEAENLEIEKILFRSDQE